MNSEIKLQVTCVHCLGTGEKLIYPIIDGNNNRMAKETLMNDDLFLYRCPHCGHYQKISYEGMYFDDKLKFALVFASDGRKLMERINFNFEGYRVRFVKTLNEMKEKIVIMENGLDDRIIEIMKHDLRTTLTSKASYNLLLANDEGLSFILLYPDYEVIKTFAFLPTDYEQLVKQYGNSLEDSFVVDAKYASKTIFRVNKINPCLIAYN